MPATEIQGKRFTELSPGDYFILLGQTITSRQRQAPIHLKMKELAHGTPIVRYNAVSLCTGQAVYVDERNGVLPISTPFCRSVTIDETVTFMVSLQSEEA